MRVKTALDLPDDLFKEVKMRAVSQGKKLKDVVADLLRRGLDAAIESQPAPQTRFIVNSRTGLPAVACARPDKGDVRLTPDRVSEILLDQEAAWHHEASR